MIHAHVTSWGIAILLFIISFYMGRKGNEKFQKIAHMSLRLFYLFILATGGYLTFVYQFTGIVMIKSIVGLVVIMAMELVLVSMKNGKSVKGSFTLLVVALILVLYLGYVVIG